MRDRIRRISNFSVNADKELELLEAADRVILQFPFYWYSSPALLKGMGRRGHHRRLGPTVEATHSGRELKLVVTTGSDAAKYLEGWRVQPHHGGAAEPV